MYALTDFNRDGAEAEYALANELATKLRSLDYVQAAAVPLTALTAWQALFDHAGLSKGESLIHGTAGGVGIFAVQFARWAGAHIIATASVRNREILRELGAQEIIDYTPRALKTWSMMSMSSSIRWEVRRWIVPGRW